MKCVHMITVTLHIANNINLIGAIPVCYVNTVL